MTEVTIDRRFNGPDGSANGGYACGVVARGLTGPTRVRLHRPPPLDTPLVLREQGDTRILEDDGGAIATGLALPSWEHPPPPPPPSLADATEARARYRGLTNHVYPKCFVCGPERAYGDGLRMFAGSLSAAPQMVACDWQPTESMVDDDGHLRTEYVWAALDCPSYFALDVELTLPFLLGQMSATLAPRIPANRSLLVYAWRPGPNSGRKYPAAAALADSTGTIWAQAQHVWIAPR